MKYIKIAFALALMVLGLNAGAQNDYDSAFREKSWFVGGGAGLNVGFDGQKYQSRSESHIGAGLDLDIYGGYWFDANNLGVRAGLQGKSISDQYTVHGKYNYMYLHADALYTVSSSFVPYIHAGYIHVKKGSPAIGAGLMMPIHLSDRLAVIPDIRLSAMSAKVFGTGLSSLGYDVSASIGLYIALGE